ncbi:6-bladed beta-propeller [Longimicrobium sp.]|uniref:6-bladed beta-propeller n=1 Tax=Longimicrobium sp. TaxID=2029185 RepID=UPI003B3A0ECD
MRSSFWTRFPARPLLAAGFLCLSACGGGGEPDAPRGAWTPGQAWRLVPQATIGAADGEGPEVFAQIVDVEFDAMGRVWIADGKQHQVRVFDSAGVRVRTIGRKGGGPEEFNGIAGMDWAADGTLWVLDGGNARFAVYDTAGRLITTRRRDVNVTVTPWPLGFDSRGNLYDRASVTGFEDKEERVVRFTPDLQPRDTFRIPPFEAPMFEMVREQGGGRRSINRVNVPFSAMQQWRIDPEGFVWIAVTDQYRLTRYRFDGTVDRIVERPIRGQPVTAEQRQKILDNYRGFQQSGGRIDESRIPKTHPVIMHFFVADDGHLWVVPFRGRGPVVDVFGPDSRYLGEVALPGVLQPSPAPAIRGDQMASVVRNADGVESVQLLRIEKPGL